MSESVKAFLKRRNVRLHPSLDPKTLERQTLERAAKFLAKPYRGGVFFYPACGDDYEYPLHRFGSACHTFVFCDWKTFSEPLDCLQPGRSVAKGISCTAPCPLGAEAIESLGDMTTLLRNQFGPPNQGMDYQLCAYLGRLHPRKGWYAELANGVATIIKCFFFHLEGVNLYRKLFSSRNVAPEVMCIKNWGNIGGEWTQFGKWNAPLGQSLRHDSRQPKFIITDRKHDWPYKQLVEKFPGWSSSCPRMWAETESAAEEWLRKSSAVIK